MSTKWCTDVLSDQPQWKHKCNKQKVKRWNIYDLYSGDMKQQLFLYEVYCAKKMKVFNEDDFTGSSRQLQKIQQYLGSNSFKFCRPFEMLIRRKTSALSVEKKSKWNQDLLGQATSVRAVPVVRSLAVGQIVIYPPPLLNRRRIITTIDFSRRYQWWQ